MVRDGGQNVGCRTPPVTYEHYAAFSVGATFQGKTSGTHKALFLFGHDAKGQSVVVPNDLITGTQLLWYVLQNTVDPSGLLRSTLREQPILRDWLASNVMPASSCSVNSTHDYCCSRGRCGISPIDFNRDLAMSLPASRTKGLAQ